MGCPCKMHAWIVRTITPNPLLQLVYLRQRGILPACAEEVAERLEGDAPVAALVEEGEGFFVVC